MIKVYNDVIAERDRIYALNLIESMPEQFWTQSVCTDSKVDQLREYMPLQVYAIINDMHNRMYKQIEHEFSVSLKKPELHLGAIVTVDRRLEGYSLPPHKDIPTGDYSRHIGSESGESSIVVSSVYYWNDDFTGGELYFEHEDFTYSPKAGELVVFYSDMDHEIKLITSGKRYSTQYFFNKKDS